MADKVIQVNVTSTKSQRVSVSPGNIQNEIIVTPDSSQYYSNLAKSWAIASGLVLGEDYSSKHYANESANSANNAQKYASNAQSVFENLQSFSNELMPEIENASTEAINAVTTTKTNAVAEINKTVTDSKQELNDIIDSQKINNPYFFGMYIFSEFQPKNISWLKSNAQWNSGAGYVDFNNWVVENANNGVENFKLSTDSYTDYDFVANITDNTFRLPVKVQQKFYNETAPVAGNGMTLGIVGAHRDGLDVINGLCAVDAGTISEESIFLTTTYGVPVGTTCKTYRTSNNNSCETIGLTTDENNSGIIAKLGSAENTNLSLYFYVGETVRNISLINVAEIASVIADKVDAQQASTASMPSSKRTTLTLGASGTNYTAPANGWFQASIKSKGTTKGTYIGMRNTTSGFHARNAQYHNSTSVENTLICNCPALKGETVNIYYDVAATISSQSLEFIYAEGDK